MSLTSIVFADESVKDVALDGHQNIGEVKKEETEPAQWPVKESSKSFALTSSSSEKKNKRFFTLNVLFCQSTQIPIFFLTQSKLWLRPPLGQFSKIAQISKADHYIL